LNVDNQDAQSDVSVITPSNANTSVDNRAQVTPGNNTKQAIKNHITQVFEQIPIYGEKKVHQQLLEDGFKVSL
jgi:hypothetical protein